MASAKKCSEEGCRKTFNSKGNICGGCRSRRYRAANPMMASYINLRANAKRRGKVFTITFEDFKEFCYETDYMVGKGRTKDCYSVDRDKEELGYIPGNLKMLTVGNNKKKHLNYDWQTKTATVTTSGEKKDEWFDE